ncbi:TPA: flagellar hook-basal body complex protein FliE [Candidatus Poribacteria bacterium]|nr:flagellar hook-basal body complex protein FliE [Candidatus Poribacteria bacterium]
MKIDQIIIPTTSNVINKPKLSLSEDEEKPKPFSKVLIESIEKVNELQKQADKAIDELAIGDSKDIVQTMIKMEKADISFRLMMQIRNKILQAYEEVMRMQV